MPCCAFLSLLVGLMAAGVSSFTAWDIVLWSEELLQEEEKKEEEDGTEEERKGWFSAGVCSAVE